MSTWWENQQETDLFTAHREANQLMAPQGLSAGVNIHIPTSLLCFRTSHSEVLGLSFQPVKGHDAASSSFLILHRVNKLSTDSCEDQKQQRSVPSTQSGVHCAAALLLLWQLLSWGTGRSRCKVGPELPGGRD